ncbi:hypothetical protein, partial [Thiolapillus sp.]|uniref:hypothetical protein n=4 Tax=Thiolapillus sp. TaxID=2017437 RepID=UPI003AF9AF21
MPQPSWSPSTTQQLRKLVAAPYLAPNDWTPRSEAYFVFPLAQGTPGKQCGLAATGVYQPSLRSPWLAAVVFPWIFSSSLPKQPQAQACLRPRDRFWDIPVPKIDSAFDNLLVPQPSWSPSTTQQLRKLVAAPYLSPNDWTPRLDAYFASPLAL